MKEYIDAYNNIGMLEVDLDNLEEAERILSKGLEICDEEELSEDDDGRSRLHHNLGNVYTELRNMNKAREHIEKDITICHRIGHCQGEAKGYINLGELHYRIQKYDEAMKCYEWALKLAKSMEDEDALISQANQNIEIVKEARKVMDEIKIGEQSLKKLSREIEIARGTEGERKCLLQQNSALDRLIEKCGAIFAWVKVRISLHAFLLLFQPLVDVLAYFHDVFSSSNSMLPNLVLSWQKIWIFCLTSLCRSVPPLLY